MGKHSFKYLLIGILIFLLGAGLNFFVVAFNGMKMPVSLRYVENCFKVVDAEGKPAPITPDTAVKLPAGRFFADSETKLLMLGDVIYLNILAYEGYYSLGDIFIELGIVNALLATLSRFFGWSDIIHYVRSRFRTKHIYA